MGSNAVTGSETGSVDSTGSGKSPSGTRLTRWFVSCLGLWLVLDVGGRFVPVEWLGILPEHVATRNPPLHAPFKPNLSLTEDPWIGETATTGNLAPTETRAPVRFSTDALGFRLTPGVASSDRVDVLLTMGASFAYGGGLSDNETLPSVLTANIGLKTYNGGRFFWDVATIDELDWLLARLGNPHPTVVALFWEQAEVWPAQLDGIPWRTDKIGRRLLGETRYRTLRQDLQDGRREVGAFWNISPLEVLSIRFFKQLSNDRFLPNPYKGAVVERRLPNGSRLLILNDEYQRAIHPPGAQTVARHTEYLAHYRDLLAQRGCDLYVVLLPNKYTLYGALIDGVPASPYLGQIEHGLSARGVRVLNGLRVLQPDAAADLAAGTLAYYREDHHWSPLGVRRIAKAIAARLGAGKGATQVAVQ